MTFLEMYNMSRVLLDKAGSPYFPKSSFDIFANIAYNDWVEQAYNKLEVTQKDKVQLQPLYTVFTKAGSDLIIFPTDVPNFRYLIRFKGSFTDSCLGVLDRNIKPVRNNDIDLILIDPFKKPIASDPLYVQTEQGGLPVFKILPTPISVEMTYIRNPQVINSNTSGGTVFEMPNEVAEQIVEMAVKKMDINIENYQQAQFNQQEINQR